MFINFALSKHLVRDNDVLTDQCGSLAYVSPDILGGKYNWILKVVTLYNTIHYRQSL